MGKYLVALNTSTGKVMASVDVALLWPTVAPRHDEMIRSSGPAFVRFGLLRPDEVDQARFELRGGCTST